MAKSSNIISSFPVKAKKKKQQIRYLYFFIIQYKNGIYIEKRVKQDIWKGLFQFPAIETKQAVLPENIFSLLSVELIEAEINYQIEGISEEYKHLLSHQIIRGRFIHVVVESEFKKTDCIFILPKDIDRYAMPRVITRYLEEKSI